MKSKLFTKLLFMFTPDMVGMDDKKIWLTQEYKTPSVSLKAIMWIVISIITALMIGQLN